jgi:hypothetical protein
MGNAGENHLQTTEKRQDSTAPLIREYEADRQKKRGPYLQNLMIGSTIPQKRCKVMWECCENWMRILDFRIKPGEDYLDVQAFTTAWGKRLKKELSETRGPISKIISRYE